MMKLVFGSYVQLSTDATKPQTIGAIVLDPKGTKGNYNFVTSDRQVGMCENSERISHWWGCY